MLPALWSNVALAAQSKALPVRISLDSRTTSTSELSPTVRRQAAEWLVELQSDTVSDETRLGWHQWRSAHPDHEQAWQRIEAFTKQLKNIPGPVAHSALISPRNARRRLAMKTAVIAFFTAGTAWTLRDTVFDKSLRADKQTGVGEQASVTLPDGTLVALNSRTAIAIRFTEHVRALHLLRGEILVTTAHDTKNLSAPRPFIVHTAQGSMRALGTRFSVRHLGEAEDADIRLAVFEGAVEIRNARSAASSQIVDANQQTNFSRDTITPLSPADEASIAWTEGLIVAQDMPLAEFLEELARHRPGHLGYSDSVANIRVSGVYPLSDTDRVLALLERTLPIEIRHISRYWVSVQARNS